eukprot:maker-scaffold_12-snap-gene-9.4-mRNA-1 protein AED:0.00 eAED:0.00 QI:144/1/1/1/1/1/4/742/318
MNSALGESLSRLANTDGFFVKQHWEALEEISNCYEQQNTYDISSIPKSKEDREKGNEGAFKFFKAEETTGCCNRMCCGENRGFSIDFLDFESKKPVLKIDRGWRCCGWAVIPCCAHRVDAHVMVKPTPDGGYEVVGDTSDETLIGQVQTPQWHGGCCCPTYYLMDQQKEYMGEIKGYTCWAMPCCICDICGADFNIYDKEGNQVAKMEKLGVGDCKDWLLEISTEADKYTVEFDAAAKLDMNFKLTVLAGVIQADFNFFEDRRGIKQCHCCDVYCCGYALPCLPLCCFAICCCCCSKEDKKRKQSLHAGAPKIEVMEV